MILSSKDLPPQVGRAWLDEMTHGAALEERGTPAVPQCRHHWLIEAPHGPTSWGTCKQCGERRQFMNSASEAGAVGCQYLIRLSAGQAATHATSQRWMSVRTWCPKAGPAWSARRRPDADGVLAPHNPRAFASSSRSNVVFKIAASTHSACYLQGCLASLIECVAAYDGRASVGGRRVLC